VFQAQSRATADDDLAAPGAGFRNDLWIMDGAATSSGS